jgi:hypothetical protein
VVNRTGDATVGADRVLRRRGTPWKTGSAGLITTTERYLHARPAGELADRFTLALTGTHGVQGLSRAA